MRLPSKNLRSTLALVACGVTLAGAGFFAGRTAPRPVPPIEVASPFVAPKVPVEVQKTAAAPAAATNQPSKATAASPIPSGAQFVASKSGTKYHPLTGCSFADRIKPENRVYFRTAREAEAAGYGPSSCVK